MELEIVAARRPDGLGSLSEEPRLRGCGRLEARVGMIRGHGMVRYLMTADGRPDTSSVEVLEAVDISEPGLASAAARLLAGCRFDPARQAGADVEVLVEQRIGFATRRQRGPPVLDPRLADPLPTPDSVLASPEVEEVPGVVSCGRLPTRELGSVTVEFVIGIDGQPEPGSARATEASNPYIGQYAERFARGCRYRSA